MLKCIPPTGATFPCLSKLRFHTLSDLEVKLLCERSTKLNFESIIFLYTFYFQLSNEHSEKLQFNYKVKTKVSRGTVMSLYFRTYFTQVRFGWLHLRFKQLVIFRPKDVSLNLLQTVL